MAKIFYKKYYLVGSAGHILVGDIHDKKLAIHLGKHLKAKVKQATHYKVEQKTIEDFTE